MHQAVVLRQEKKIHKTIFLRCHENGGSLNEIATFGWHAARCLINITKFLTHDNSTLLSSLTQSQRGLKKVLAASCVQEQMQ